MQDLVVAVGKGGIGPVEAKAVFKSESGASAPAVRDVIIGTRGEIVGEHRMQRLGPRQKREEKERKEENQRPAISDQVQRLFG